MKLINIVLILSLFTAKVALRDRRSLFDDLQNGGLKIPGKIQFVYLSGCHYLFFTGISNKIADLVSQAFNKNNEAGNKNRQDTVMVGSIDSTSDSSFTSGLLKLLGFDSTKIGAFALNGIVFIAQMVRTSANKLINLVMEKTWDWYLIADHINKRIENDTSFINQTSESNNLDLSENKFVNFN